MKPVKLMMAASILVSLTAVPSRAEVRSQATILIHAPIERIWGLVVDVDRWPQWNKAIENAHLEGAVLQGSVFQWKSGGYGIRSTFQDVDPMKHLSWTGAAFGTKAFHTWDFSVTGDGVAVTTAETFSGWLPAIMPGTMQKTLDDTLPALLQSLKLASETRAGAVSP